MQVNIKVVSVEIQTKPTAKGSYQMAILAYRNESSGKLEEKKFVSFTDKDIFNTVAGAKEGQQFTVTMEKGEKYWEWKAMVQQAPGSASGTTPTSKPSSFTGQTVQSRTYETAEERAARQVLIVRQSSLTAALATLTPGSKSALDPSAVTKLAQEYTDWVFQTGVPPANNMFTEAELANIPNDL